MLTVTSESCQNLFEIGSVIWILQQKWRRVERAELNPSQRGDYTRKFNFFRAILRMAF